MIAALLSWTKLPQWAIDIIALGLIAAAVWFWQHERYESGIKEQRTVDAASRADLQKTVDAETAAIQAQATATELAYEKERQANMDYQRAHPVGVIQLCQPTPVGHSGMSATRAPYAGNATIGTPAGIVQPVPSGDSIGGSGATTVDIGPMLSAFGIAADDVSATLREFQTR